jgi:hypothetical protein
VSNDQLIFKQAKWYVVVYDISILLVTGACIWLNVDSFLFYKRPDVATYQIVSLAFLFIFCPMVFLGRRYLADIHVDGDGISWWFWGRRWKYIQWTDVKVMTIETIVSYGLVARPVTLYSFYRAEKTPTFFYPLKFGDDIKNGRELIAAVTKYVRQHNIKVLDRRAPEIREN